MEVLHLIAVVGLIIGIPILLKNLNPKTRSVIQIILAIIMLVWIWGFEEGAQGPRMVITSLMLYSLYAAIKTIKSQEVSSLEN